MPRFVFSAILAVSVVASGAQQTTRQSSAFAPEGTPIALGLAGYAKVLCSAVFVSGRDPAEAFRNSGYFFFPEDQQPGVTYEVDRNHKLVRMTHGAITRTAKFYGDQGCIIHPQGHDGIFFTPVSVKTRLPDASSQVWPMGDKDPTDPLPHELDRSHVTKAVDAAFADPDALTAAFVVVYKGRIVGERYLPGITKETQLESWSMGKSLTATLFALLVNDGLYRIDDAAPVPEWQKPGDPRAKIRIVDLLHMSSGLRFIAGQDPDYTPDKGYPDHTLIYTGAIDAFQHSMTRPLQFPPNTEGRYRNSDPLMIGWLIKQAVTKRGEEYLTFPQRALFDRIGIRRQVLETDPYGNFLLTGYDYGTARNWARIGLLYLQDGVWQGQRLLPEGWAKFVSTPAPAWKQPVYGGLFWVNGDGAWPIPKGAYFANGAGGQRTVIIPSHDLVVVRMGHYRGDRAGMKALNAALAELMLAVPSNDRGDTRRAAAELQQAEALLPAASLPDPFNPPPPQVPIWFALGSTYLATGNDSEAAARFERIVGANAMRMPYPIEFVRSLYFLGQISERRGERDKAAAYYRRFLKYWADGDIDRHTVADAQKKLAGT